MLILYYIPRIYLQWSFDENYDDKRNAIVNSTDCHMDVIFI